MDLLESGTLGMERLVSVLALAVFAVTLLSRLRSRLGGRSRRRGVERAGHIPAAPGSPPGGNDPDPHEGEPSASRFDGPGPRGHGSHLPDVGGGLPGHDGDVGGIGTEGIEGDDPDMHHVPPGREEWDGRGFSPYGVHRRTGTFFDPDGFDIHGYDEEGYDRDGYDFQGYNRRGSRRRR